MTRVYADTSKIIDLTRVDAADVKTPVDALDTLMAELVFTGGRLSINSSDPVPSSDSTETTLYYLPYGGAPDCGLLSLWNSTTSGINQLDVSASPPSVDLSSVNSATLYDVFGYINSGAVALELLVWTSSTAGSSSRATALTWQNGLLCKSGDATRRYLGTILSNGAGEVTDGRARRGIYNAYNQVPRQLLASESTPSWTYATATFRASNNDATNNRLHVVAGLDGTYVELTFVEVTGGTTISAWTGIAKNGTTPANDVNRSGSDFQTMTAALNDVMAAGYHHFTPVEYVDSGTATFYGTPYHVIQGYVMG